METEKLVRTQRLLSCLDFTYGRQDSNPPQEDACSSALPYQKKGITINCIATVGGAWTSKSSGPMSRSRFSKPPCLN